MFVQAEDPRNFPADLTVSAAQLTWKALGEQFHLVSREGVVRFKRVLNLNWVNVLRTKTRQRFEEAGKEIDRFFAVQCHLRSHQTQRPRFVLHKSGNSIRTMPIADREHDEFVSQVF